MSGNSPIQWTDASGRKLGRLKQVAKQLGISLEDYLQRRESGQKWCIGCREWHSYDAFAVDRSRSDGLTASCVAYRNAHQRSHYTPKGRRTQRGWLVAAREGDMAQARRRVNYLVEQGRLPRPNALPCSDCGHVWQEGERRHEYDHYAGYSTEDQLSVQAVCSACHHMREEGRRTAS